MKRTLVACLLAFIISSGLLMLNSCSRFKSITIHKTYSDITFVIPAPMVAGTFEIEKDIQADLKDLALQNGFDISKIESATINAISLQIADTTLPSYTFGIVDNAVCSLSADGVSVTEVGTDDAIHTSPTQIDFELNDIDVTSYLKASSYKAKIKFTTNTDITHDVPMIASIQCSIKVTPFK